MFSSLRTFFAWNQFIRRVFGGTTVWEVSKFVILKPSHSIRSVGLKVPKVSMLGRGVLASNCHIVGRGQATVRN